MSRIFYTIGIHSYYLLIRLISPFHKKAGQMIRGRRNIWVNLADALKHNNAPVIWFHCASLGEFEQGRPLMEALRTRMPEHKILLTFFSPSGYEIRKNYPGADWIFYLPFDSKHNAQKLVEIVKPNMVFFVKYEFWYYFLKTLSEKQIPVYLISALFRQNQIFFQWYGKFFRDLLHLFKHIFVQNKVSEQLLLSSCVSAVSVSGDTRFDRVHAQLAMTNPLPLIELFQQNHRLFIGGSVWDADMKLLIPLIHASPSEVRFILAPHEINLAEISNWRQQLSCVSVLYSDASRDTSLAKDAKVLIIDSIGLLSSIYRYGDFAHVGGAFGKGLHNILEAATFGMPISFGPNIQKFPEAIALIETGSAVSVQNFDELQKFFTDCLNPEIHKHRAEASRQFVQRNRGACEHILQHIVVTPNS